jgi:hypothetical protein
MAKQTVAELRALAQQIGVQAADRIRSIRKDDVEQARLTIRADLQKHLGFNDFPSDLLIHAYKAFDAVIGPRLLTEAGPSLEKVLSRPREG